MRQERPLWILALTFIIVTTILLTGCQGGRYENPGSESDDYHEGTEGIAVSIMEQAPPPVVFEGSTFDLQANMHNKGAFNLYPNYTMTMSLKYDSSSVHKTDDATTNDRYESLEGIQLEGRSQSFPDGEKNDVAIGRFEARDIQSNYEKDMALFVLNYCYPYKTMFSDMVCIDTDVQKTDSRQQVCEASDKKYSDGQGAPVSVTEVESQMVPVGNYVRPQFTLHIKQHGDGYVSDFILGSNARGPDADANRRCGTINETTINLVRVNARIGNDTLNCLPEKVRLEDGKAEVQCQLDDTDILGVKASYYTELFVELSYLYNDRVSKEVAVKRSGDPTFHSQQEIKDNCMPWEKEHDGECISKCEYYAENHAYEEFQNISEQLEQTSTDWKVEYSPLAYAEKKSEEEQDAVYNAMGCMYGDLRECRRAGGNCIPTNGLCFPGSYCGWPSCMDSNNRPQAVAIQQVGDSIKWQCSDPDSDRDVQRTCGCAEKAYYTFTNHDLLNKSSRCKNIPKDQYEEVEGSFSEVYGMNFEVDLPKKDSEDDTICIMVEDKLQERSITNFRFKH